MTKRISALLLVVTLMISFMVPFAVNAAAEPFQKTVDVLADIEVKTGSGAYADGPLTIQLPNGSALPSFDFKATLNMQSVREAFNHYYAKEYFEKLLDMTISDSDYADIKANTKVKGEMTTTVTVPAGLPIPEAFVNGTDMLGYGPSANLAVHKEVSRTLNGNTLEIKTKVVDPSDSSVEEVAGETLAANIDTYLGDLYLECTGLVPAAQGTYKIIGSVTGYTDIYYYDSKVATITYNVIQDTSNGESEIAEIISVSFKSGGYSSGGGTGKPEVKPQKEITLEFSVNGDKTLVAPITKKGDKLTVNLDEVKAPEKAGYAAMGTWYSDVSLTTPVSGEYTITEDTVLYTSYVNTRKPAVFADDHYGYIQGYPDGTVMPERNVTREEVAALLYRLLAENTREELKSTENDFSDVEAERWSNTEISTMVKGGYIKGYEDGSFKPAQFITRAEFATLIARFIDVDAEAAINTSFSDISGHWAEEYIKKAANYMLITGYEDGSFRPDRNITRAEAVTILNRILVRHVDKEGLHEDAKHWPDNEEGKWYFYNILEATNSHDHTRRENGYHEDWTSRNEIRDWTLD